MLYKKGFTLAETLIALTLLAVLFSIMGGLLTGMAKLSALVDSNETANKEIDFCFDIIRKELSEIIYNSKYDNYKILAGNGFLAYATNRKELIVRDSMPMGAKRVEWRFESGTKRIVRSVFSIPAPGVVLPSAEQTAFFDSLNFFQISIFRENEWHEITSVSENLTGISAIKLRLGIGESEKELKMFQTTFQLPYEIPNI
jgi:prepilin-type N-terminal cleavage/methylation domain-containing protein